MRSTNFWITNCKIILKDRIEKGAVRVSEGNITKIILENKVGNIYKENLEMNLKETTHREYDNQIIMEPIVDAKGMYLSPGFIDIHLHGAGGYDTMDGNAKALEKSAKTIVKHGTTAFLPTTMTVSIPEINQTLHAIKAFIRDKAQADKFQLAKKSPKIDGAQILGVHLEGPFVNPKAIGAQNPKYLLLPSIRDYDEMVKGCEDIVVSMTLAPELNGAKELIEYATNKGIVCSAGHTQATYEQMIKAVEWGISHVTHLYNAMTPFNHREPGVVGAAFDTHLTAEIIADGIHVSYPALRIAYKQKSIDKMLLITDAMMACCMPDGKYALGGQDVYLKEGAARLENGALAGSVLTLEQAISNVYHYCNLPLHEVVKMATYNPAKFCKVEDTKGLIKEGYDADLVLFDENVQVNRVWIKGEEQSL